MSGAAHGDQRLDAEAVVSGAARDRHPGAIVSGAAHGDRRLDAGRKVRR
jgi:hypothetical protein